MRDIQEKNGDSYQQLTSNLSADYDGIFANKADIVMTIVIEKNIDENKHINGTERYMYFRSDGFVDAGGRFGNMPEKVEYGAKNYIEAFEAGVKGAIKGKVTDKEIEKRKKKEVEERTEAANEYSKEEKANKVKDDRNAELVASITSSFKVADKDTKDKFKALRKELAPDVSTIDELVDLPTEIVEKLLAVFNEEE